MARQAQRINDFLIHTLGLTVTNRTWSWDAYNHDWPDDVVVMKLWSKRFFTDPDGTERIEVWAPPPWPKPATNARRERRKFITRLQNGGPTYAVLRDGEGSENPQPYLYDADVLYKLSGVVTDAQGYEFAIVESRVPVAEFLAGRPGLEQDLAAIAERYPDNPTTRERLVQARLGQGTYRAALLALWDDACAVTGCGLAPVLVASHAKPWADSTDDERLDPHNGLPLVGTLDRLFDTGLIGFDPATGTMHVADAVDEQDQVLFGIPAPLRRKPGRKLAAYLQHHLDHVFQGEREDDEAEA